MEAALFSSWSWSGSFLVNKQYGVVHTRIIVFFVRLFSSIFNLGSWCGWFFYRYLDDWKDLVNKQQILVLSSWLDERILSRKSNLGIGIDRKLCAAYTSKIEITILSYSLDSSIYLILQICRKDRRWAILKWPWKECQASLW